MRRALTSSCSMVSRQKEEISVITLVTWYPLGFQDDEADDVDDEQTEHEKHTHARETDLQNRHRKISIYQRITQETLRALLGQIRKLKI